MVLLRPPSLALSLYLLFGLLVRPSPCLGVSLASSAEDDALLLHHEDDLTKRIRESKHEDVLDLWMNDASWRSFIEEQQERLANHRILSELPSITTKRYTATYTAYWASYHMHKGCAPPQPVVVEVSCLGAQVVYKSSDDIQCNPIENGLRCWDDDAFSRTALSTPQFLVQFTCMASSSRREDDAAAMDAVRTTSLVLEARAPRTRRLSRLDTPSCPNQMDSPYYSTTVTMLYSNCIDGVNPMNVLEMGGVSKRCYCFHDYSQDGGPQKFCAGQCNEDTGDSIASVTTQEIPSSCVQEENVQVTPIDPDDGGKMPVTTKSLPSALPSSVPSKMPSISSMPSMGPVAAASNAPSGFPSTLPSEIPSMGSVAAASSTPSGFPSTLPSGMPSIKTYAPPSWLKLGLDLPPGPYVTPDIANERVTIPHPPKPDSEVHEQIDCPHWDSDLLDWHDPATWTSGQIPQEEQDIMLPANSRVIIRTTVHEELGVITIPSTSELVIAEPDSDRDIHLDIHGMSVLGRLTVGSETCRIRSTARIILTLHGTRPVDAVTVIPATTYKGIDVNQGGILSLHGKRFYRTWTRLAKTVNPGETMLLLQDEVNWEPGQTIVLVTTAMKDSREWHRNEVLTVDSVHHNPVANVGAVVIVSTPIQFTHEAIIGAYQAEVGLLSRNIVIQGAEHDSEPTDPDPLTCIGSTSFYGDKSIPCANTDLTGFGGHIIVRSNGKGYVEGVELHRMGQTNLLGRYPMHFHMLGDEHCSDCYLTDSSIHRSFYRCISIHGTNRTLVSENVAYDVTGYCFYLEDGVEEYNTISFNLAAHIHIMLGSSYTPPTASGIRTPLYRQSSSLTLPADVTAAGFYITNIRNYIIGNSASGGWAGFAFPHLPAPLGPHRNRNFRPMNVLGLTIDGNMAHSTAWWWQRSGAFYFGGSLYYDLANPSTLVYNPGRDTSNKRETCLVDKCIERGNCDSYCLEHERAWITVSNNKAYLAAGAGLNAWNGRLDILTLEAHDTGLSLEGLQDGFFIDNLLSVCRTGHDLGLPVKAKANRIRGNGFFWYDTTQEHIMTNSAFRQCGIRSDEFDQYNSDPTRGCSYDDPTSGCRADSFVFGLRGHSDQHNPEMMQATRNITFENCGRRFSIHKHDPDYPTTVSGRLQNWLDVDGSVSGFDETVFIASGLTDTGLWWIVDDNVVYEPQGPLQFIKKSGGPERGLGHVKLYFDRVQHDRVPNEICSNGKGKPCPAIGYIRHLGLKFASDPGMPVTANADVAGMVGGFGWFLTLNEGAPQTLRFELVEVMPDTPFMFSLAYPSGTTIDTISAHALSCRENSQYSCDETFHRVDTVKDVRNSSGNAYHFDDNTGVLTIRIIMMSRYFVGNPRWVMNTFDDPGRYNKGYALGRFERDGILLPKLNTRTFLEVTVNCPLSPTNPAYCDGTPLDMKDFDVCRSGYRQTGYDKCCSQSDPTDCIFANGGIVDEP